MKQLCILLVRFYRKFLSPIKGGPCCRFYPTCSAYALEAFTKRGFFVGLYLTVWRILRCNPFCPGGYDPVPERARRPKGPSRTRSARGSKEMRPIGRPHDAIPNLGREDTAPVRSRRRRPPNAPHRKDRNRTRRRKKAKR